MNCALQPEGLGQLSPGQRPGFTATRNTSCSLKGCDTHTNGAAPAAIARAQHAPPHLQHQESTTAHRPGPDQRLFAYLAGTLNELKCPALAVGGVADHVHILFSLVHTISRSDAVEDVKKSSSKWMKQNGDPRFYWQGGYGAFSVSASNEKTVMDDIAIQPVKHRKLTFQDEFRAFLRKHRMKWDERYVWD